MKKSAFVNLLVGVIGGLLFSLGMSCCMAWGGIWFIPGIVIGCIGIAGAATAYPIYKHLVKQDRERIAPEILRLSEELMQGEISEWSF